ncbi:PEP-CTERM sorting domain-containing protein [Qipengyuania sp. YG27]|uniref:PEP-CTERM sorting domain-containing protein n=1 Tax=Qipengyuania mesophila TaxID=2867246 RepID=A0ABS7JYE0_9SPHN|nr:PEP-CTERM sorting domain-containing protein [Qipengyuania mesophila]MBX7502676.1 PEP-CTERM sorting domain-containing protein [Qipengyuania mesophila]
MRLVNLALATASLLVAASSASAMTKPPREPGETAGSGGTAVPEPGSFAMMGTGLAGYGAAAALYRRRKRKQKG